MTTIANKLQTVQARIAAACSAAGRSQGCVHLLAVSKTFGPEAVWEARSAGQLAFGENYIQEAVEKIRSVREWEADAAAVASLPRPGTPCEWHCIGPVQSNKTRTVAEHFDWVHSVDRLKIAQRLSEQRPAHLAPLQVCLQLNVDAAGTKAGVAPDDVLALAQAVAALPGLRLRGLMTMPDPVPEFDAQVALHARARACLEQLNLRGFDLDTLSMGMSADLEAAVHAGSTLVRVGTAIFGGRASAQP